MEIGGRGPSCWGAAVWEPADVVLLWHPLFLWCDCYITNTYVSGKDFFYTRMDYTVLFDLVVFIWLILGDPFDHISLD